MQSIKILLIITPLFLGINTYAQDSYKIENIDTLVSSINKLNLQVHLDSSTQKVADIEMEMKTYSLVVFDNGVLRKYQIKMSSFDHDNDVYTPFSQSTTFYYDQNTLIKVEKSRLQFEKQSVLEWYFSDDKLIKCTDTNSSLASSFLINAKEFLKRAKWIEKK